MRVLVPVLGLLMLGCSGLLRSSESTRHDIQEHLVSTYGEEFVVTRLVGQRFGSGGFPDKANYEAYPVADPTLVFRGTADYEARPNRVSDTYACEQVARWLPGQVEATLGEGHRLVGAHVRCGSSDGLPPHPEPGAPLPPGLLTLNADVRAYVDGDPLEVAEGARAALVRSTRALGVRPRGVAESYPPELWPYASTWEPPEGALERADEDWHRLALARARVDRPDEPAQRWERSRELEDRVVAVVTEACPDARVSVVARKKEASGSDERFSVDVRLAQDGLDDETVANVAGRVHASVGDHVWELRGIDSPGLGQPQRRGFVCGGIGCREVGDALIDPSVVASAAAEAASDAR